MSQLRSEEIFNPDQIIDSCPKAGSPIRFENSISTGSPQNKSQDCQSISGSSSSSQSLISDYTHPFETALASSESGSVVDDTEDISSSFSSSLYNIINSSSGSSIVRNSSWKSVTSGSEELTSDVSCTNLSSAGSEAESSAHQSDHQEIDNLSSDKDDQFSSDGFETENSESESNLKAVHTFRKFTSEGSLDKGPRNRRTRGLHTSPQFPVSRIQAVGLNNTVFNIDQNDRGNRGAANANQRINILRRFDNFLHRMSVRVARYHKELCIVFLILASGIASLKSSPPKIRATSVPSPFFEEKDASYFLQDNYMGEYLDLANKQIPYHPSFLFYYAPWDSESVASKSVYLAVAKHFFFTYHGRMKFYAINCWWPGGQCRKNFKNLSHFPIFFAHIGKSPGIIYNGPIRLEPMVKFINSLLKPVTRIDTEEELWHFRAQHDVIMLGYFNFTTAEATEAYETYLQMALRTFEADPFNQVGFGVFLRPELAEKFFLTSSNAISLVLFNEIHTAKWHGGYHTQGLKGPVSQVAEWIIDRTKTVPLTWVYALRNGFANRPVALGPHDFAQQLSKGPIFLLVTRRYFPSGHSPFYMQTKEIALDYFNCNRSGNVTKLRRTAHKVNAEWASIWSSVVQICQRKGSYQCQQMQPNIQHWLKKRALFKREPLQHYENISGALNFTGLSCVSERQFKFLAIDPVDVPYFIKLGLSGLKSTDGYSGDFYIDPMAFIIDSENDIILPLSSLNISEVATAIHNYTAITETGDVNKIPSRLFLNNESKKASIESQSSSGYFKSWGAEDLIHYINGDMQHNNSVLLLYTASFCGYCAMAITHAASLSRFISENYGVGSLKVTLAKIDMFKNSLPPELSPERLPTVIFIPNWNRSDIRLYPESQDITSAGLLRFILSELDPITRVKASLMSPLCGSTSGQCSTTTSSTDSNCRSSPSSASVLSQTKSNSTMDDRQSCIKSSRSSVSSQIELLLQRLQNGEEAMFNGVNGPINQMTPQTWNGQLLDRLRTLAVTLDVS